MIPTAEPRFGTELRRLRNKANLNLLDVSYLTGMTMVQISRIERGESEPDEEAKQRLLRIVGGDSSDAKADEQVLKAMGVR